MKTLAQHLHRCALDRLGCVSISGVRTSLCIGLANPLRSSCNARNATFYNTAMGLISISFFHMWGVGRLEGGKALAVLCGEPRPKISLSFQFFASLHSSFIISLLHSILYIHSYLLQCYSFYSDSTNKLLQRINYQRKNSIKT